MIESLSLIDAVMPDIVASRQQAQVQQQGQQQATGTASKGPPGLIKNEAQETNGEESKTYYYNNPAKNFCQNLPGLKTLLKICQDLSCLKFILTVIPCLVW
jgi:hypothetical protein